MEIVHSASSEATPPKLPSELYFKWVNPFDMNFLGPQHYCLLETDGQIKALCRVLDKKEVDFGWLNYSRCVMDGMLKLEAQNEKCDDQQGEGWTNRVWDPGKSFMNQYFWGVTAYIGVLRGLLKMNWDPLEQTKFKHWWGFRDEFKHKPP
ncbi:hypothetical protein PIB30_072953 [Stylosanthes scabra]|uniref:Uncharacterized protein n=1 Tax=Stylosanthes scabra TaxID=79078 RepID=A0ABU6XP76_9FABA|nr:hypothetical protein [Stylosanthes scabra]